MIVTFSIENEVVKDFNETHKRVNKARAKYSKFITKSLIIEKAMLSFIKKNKPK